MGCWNQTCGLTQIHIRAGEKVMVFPLSESRDDSLCYTTPFWSPFPVPFYSEYNDYGAGENSSGIGLNMALAEIQNNLVEVEQGENQFHDIPVKKEGFNEEVFWEAIHEQRLVVTGGYGNKQYRIGMVMIKQSVLDHLIDNYEFEVYVGWDRKTNESKYVKYKFQRVLNDLPVFVDAMLGLDSEVGELTDDDDVNELRRIMMRHNPLEYVARQLLGDQYPANDVRAQYEENVNRAAKWLCHRSSHLSYGGGFCSSAIIDCAVADLVEANDREGLIELLTEVLKLYFVDAMMMITRKFWSPQAGAGSQNDDHAGYRALMAAMAHALDVEKAEWDEGLEDEDEDEDDLDDVEE